MSLNQPADFPLRINWLPTTRAMSIAVARAVEAAGFDGLGVCDSPNYLEMYTAIETCLGATTTLKVGSNVTNPLTRHWSVHASAARAMFEHGAERTYLGFGTGDSAVRTDGSRPSTIDGLAECIQRVRDSVGSDLVLNVAAGGPRGAAVATRFANGLVAGVGTSSQAVSALVRSGGPPSITPFAVWASLRVAVADDTDGVDRLRRTMLARAISAARFNFAAGFEGRDVPVEFQHILRAGFGRYDFAWHGRGGANPNAGLFSGHPDVESFLLDRFAVVGTPEHVASRIAGLRDAGFTGAFMSILFEDPLPEIERIRDALVQRG